MCRQYVSTCSCLYWRGCSTKAGYIADDIADNLMIRGSKNKGVVTDDILGGNCIHPNCLDASLKRSLSALNLAMVQFCPTLLQCTEGVLNILRSVTSPYSCLLFTLPGWFSACPSILRPEVSTTSRSVSNLAWLAILQRFLVFKFRHQSQEI